MVKKKYILIGVVFLIIILVVLYIYNNRTIEVSNNEVKFLDLNNTKNETIVKENVPSKKIKIDNEEMTLAYEETIGNLDIYENDNKEDYIFKDDKLVGFLKRSSSNNNVEIDEEQAKKNAEEFGKDNIDKFNKYEITYSNYIESYNEYSFIYVRKINDIDTQDTVAINVEGATGKVASFRAFHQGEFEKYKRYKLDVETINNLCIEAVKNKYGEKLKETEIQDQYLKILDGKLVLQTDIDVEWKEKDTFTEIHGLESLVYVIN